MTERIIDTFFKFKIGDVLRPKVQGPGYNRDGQRLNPQLMVVVERNLTECYGGIQANYFMRCHSTSSPGYFGSEAGYAFTIPLVQMTEPELMLAEDMGLTQERQPRKRPSSLDEPPAGEDDNGDPGPVDHP